MKVIVVKELFSNAFSQKQALILRAEIQKLLDEEEKVIIDFKHVSNCTVLFFNFSTGYFISLLGVEKYNEKIALKGLSQSGELSYKSSCKVVAERYNPKIQNEILSIISNPDD